MGFVAKKMGGDKNGLEEFMKPTKKMGKMPMGMKKPMMKKMASKKGM
jgi:hypothetical protein